MKPLALGLGLCQSLSTGPLGPVYRTETNAYIDRVLTDPDDVVSDATLVDNIIGNLVDRELYQACVFYIDSKAGVRKRTVTDVNYAEVAYDMSQKASDVSQIKDSCQPIISTDGFLFDGTDDSLKKVFSDASDGNTRFPVSSKLSICAWIYYDSTSSIAGRIAVVNGAWGAFVSPFFSYSVGFIGSSVDAGFTSTSHADAWHFMVITFDAELKSGNIKLYLDNNSTPVGAIDKASTLTAVDAEPFCVGNRSAGDRSWKGKIDHVSVFTSILSEEDQASIYNLVKNRYKS